MSDVTDWVDSVTKQRSTGQHLHPDDLRAGKKECVFIEICYTDACISYFVWFLWI